MKPKGSFQIRRVSRFWEKNIVFFLIQVFEIMFHEIFKNFEE